MTLMPEEKGQTASDFVHGQIVRNTSEPRAAGKMVLRRCWWLSGTGSGHCVSQKSKHSGACQAGPAAFSQAGGSSRPSALVQNRWFALWDGCRW